MAKRAAPDQRRGAAALRRAGLKKRTGTFGRNGMAVEPRRRGSAIRGVECTRTQSQTKPAINSFANLFGPRQPVVIAAVANRAERTLGLPVTRSRM